MTSNFLFLAATLLMTTTTPCRRPATPARRRQEAARGQGAASAPTRSDEYYWLRDDTRKNPEMLAYLNAENAYADAVLAPLQAAAGQAVRGDRRPHQAGRQPVPYRERGYWYYTRFETGKDYPIHARRKGGDGRARGDPARRQRDGRGQGLLQVGDWEVSQDNRLLAWADDTVGRRQYTLRVKDLATGRCCADAITGIVGRTWSGPTTTGPSSTSRTTRRPC